MNPCSIGSQEVLSIEAPSIAHTAAITANNLFIASKFSPNIQLIPFFANNYPSVILGGAVAPGTKAAIIEAWGRVSMEQVVQSETVLENTGIHIILETFRGHQCREYGSLDFNGLPQGLDPSFQ